MIDFRTPTSELPALDFSVDPNVVARTRVALIVNQARQNEREATANRLREEADLRDMQAVGIRWVS